MSAYTAAGSTRRQPHPVDVIDTVGAGDAFMSGLLDALLRRDLLTPAGLRSVEPAVLDDVLDDAALVAAITCTRAGANPPRRSDLDAWRDRTQH